LRLERFKRFADTTLDFTHPDSGQPLDLVVLVGENGSGKSSILQAIAMTLGRATRQVESPIHLNWPGFDPESASRIYRGDWQIALQVEFSEDELAASNALQARDNLDQPNANWPVARSVTLVQPEPKRNMMQFYVLGGIDEPRSGLEGQFLGRFRVYNLLNTDPNTSQMFKRVGAIYWYHDQRTTYHLTPFMHGISSTRFSTVRDNNDLRRLITNWFAAEGRPKVADFNRIYAQMFPGRALARIGDTFTSEAPLVFFRDHNGVEYELAELSGGESALLPLILDFVQWDINQSVILIDEIELHLHPPLQQTLIAMLPKLGINNQFIITTHSDAVFSVVPASSVRRIDALSEPVAETTHG